MKQSRSAAVSVRTSRSDVGFRGTSRELGLRPDTGGFEVVSTWDRSSRRGFTTSRSASLTPSSLWLVLTAALPRAPPSIDVPPVSAPEFASRRTWRNSQTRQSPIPRPWLGVTPQGHEGRVWSANFSPNGRVLAASEAKRPCDGRSFLQAPGEPQMTRGRRWEFGFLR